MGSTEDGQQHALTDRTRPQHEPCEHDQHPALQPPRFGLTALFVGTTAVALALALVPYLGGVGMAALLLTVFVIFAHVAGNALGQRLRRHGNVPRAAQVDASSPTRPRQQPASHHFAPATRLSHRTQLGWTMTIFTVLGVAAGSSGGGYLLAQINRDNLTASHLALAALSCGVVGGLFGFWAGSFTQIAAQAWWQAHSTHAPPRRPK